MLIWLLYIYKSFTKYFYGSNSLNKYIFSQDINEQSYKQQPLFEIGFNHYLKGSLDDPKLLHSICFKSFNIISVLWQLPGKKHI